MSSKRTKKAPTTTKKAAAGKKKAPARKPAIVKSKPASKSPRKPHRFKPGTVALRNIRKQQKETDLAFPEASFARFAREKAQDYMDEEIRFSKDALTMLQVYLEERIIKLFREANKLALHANRQSVMPVDLRLARQCLTCTV